MNVFIVFTVAEKGDRHGGEHCSFLTWSAINVLFFSTSCTKEQKLMHHPFPDTHTYTCNRLERRGWRQTLIHNRARYLSVSLCLYNVPAKILTDWVKEQDYWLSGLVVMNGEQPVSCWGTNTRRGEERRRDVLQQERLMFMYEKHLWLEAFVCLDGPESPQT